MFSEINSRMDRVAGGGGSGGKARHDLAIMHRDRDRTLVGHQDHRWHGCAGWVCLECHRPRENRNPRPFQDIRTVTSGFGPGRTVAAVGSSPGEIDRTPSRAAVL